MVSRTGLGNGVRQRGLRPADEGEIDHYVRGAVVVRRAHSVPRQAGSGPTHHEFQLSILDGFELRAGGRTLLAGRGEAQRLLTLLALRDRPVSRGVVATMLRPDAPEAQGLASLRSALARLDPDVRHAIVIAGADLALTPDVSVDLRDARAFAQRLLETERPLPWTDLQQEASQSLQALTLDLLPGWKEEWAIMESEAWRQLRLHALDALSVHLTQAGRFASAAGAAAAVLQSEPLRESACAALIRVHLAAGNRSEAIRVFTEFRARLMRELGLAPSPVLCALLAPALPSTPGDGG
ncbi:MAG: BTAD domain-containing putative transcriptional regulator [Dehalococcoidia bacterium]|nr:BTAD domain-containing putative transcriptional regulator [Dehalococcoidia bacterium]